MVCSFLGSCVVVVVVVGFLILVSFLFILFILFITGVFTGGLDELILLTCWV